MLFPRFTALLLLVAICLSLSTPGVSASLEVHPNWPSRATAHVKPQKPTRKGEPKRRVIRIDDKALLEASSTGGPSSWCAGPPKFPVGQPVDLLLPTPSGDRHVVLYIPSSYEKRKQWNGRYTPVALQVLFHGLRDECHNFLHATGFMPYAEKDGYILVSACGASGWFGRAWNAGTCCGFYHDAPDDVAFARQIVQLLTNSACVDPAKVFATGFSNGGMLSEVLACEAPDVFRAVASVSGVVELRPGNEEGLELCTAALRNQSSRASVLMIHGDKDLFVPWEGLHTMGFPPITNNTLGWVLRSGCDEKALHTTINTTDFLNVIYDDCSPDRTRGMEGGVDSTAFSPAIYSTNEEDSLDLTALSKNPMWLRYLNAKPRSIVHLDRKERAFQRQALRQHLYPSAPDTSSEVGGENGSKAESKNPSITVELVRGIGYRHHWYETKNFSTTDYIYRFGLRVFGSY
ncbi:unnamed protein product [Phytomonas sp. EM1]|nr:unnamed protein product [Phytomonas sp. EM1]|eukprot:CCW63875.1 unnamed protein product [Phytomonas sp. isolate EM1]